MALLPYNQNSQGDGVPSTSSPPLTNTKPSNADITRGRTPRVNTKYTMKQSLMHQSTKTPEMEDENKTININSKLFEYSRSPNALLMDLTIPLSKGYTMDDIKGKLVNSFKSTFGCILQLDGPRRYFEVYIAQIVEYFDIMENGLILEEEKLTIFPNIALSDDAKVAHLQLSNLPMLQEEDMLKGLQLSLTPFGEIIDIGIYKDKKYGLLTGAGYAVLNVNKDDNNKKEN